TELPHRLSLWTGDPSLGWQKYNFHGENRNYRLKIMQKFAGLGVDGRRPRGRVLVKPARAGTVRSAKGATGMARHGGRLHPILAEELDPHELELFPGEIAFGELLLGYLEAAGLAAFEVVDDLVLFVGVQHFVDGIVKVELGAAGGNGLH